LLITNAFVLADTSTMEAPINVLYVINHAPHAKIQQLIVSIALAYPIEYLTLIPVYVKVVTMSFQSLNVMLVIIFVRNAQDPPLIIVWNALIHKIDI